MSWPITRGIQAGHRQRVLRVPTASVCEESKSCIRGRAVWTIGPRTACNHRRCVHCVAGSASGSLRTIRPRHDGQAAGVGVVPLGGEVTQQQAVRQRNRLVRVVLGVCGALLVNAAAYVWMIDLPGPVDFDIESLTALPADLQIVAHDESCGQGRTPIDCAALVLVAGPGGSDEATVAADLAGHLCDRGWRCVEGREGRWQLTRAQLWNQDLSIMIEPASIAERDTWAASLLERAIPRHPHALLSYSSVRG